MGFVYPDSFKFEIDRIMINPINWCFTAFYLKFFLKGSALKL